MLNEIRLLGPGLMLGAQRALALGAPYVPLVLLTACVSAAPPNTRGAHRHLDSRHAKVKTPSGTSPANPRFAPRIMHRLGECPRTYQASAHLCRPQPNSPYVIVRKGPCPYGYIDDGAYCRIDAPDAPYVFTKVSVCPLSFKTHRGYCIKRREVGASKHSKIPMSSP
ncbi:MAG: hypothetical protein VX589_01920 [Myxococcota bacterium]|nr:hypothetical protein [Myxococcota bacterium]